MEKSDEHPQKLRVHVSICVEKTKLKTLAPKHQLLDAFDFYLTPPMIVRENFLWTTNGKIDGLYHAFNVFFTDKKI